jgi:hypothetical protein
MWFALMAGWVVAAWHSARHLATGRRIHDVRAEQAAEYERLFAERELPRWREYQARGAFISARIFRAAFGTDPREDVAKYVIVVEVPSHAQHSEHDADPGFQEFNRLADAFQPEDPLVYGGEVLHAV